MFWAPVANVVLSAVRPEEEGQASGAQNAIRELGGVFGVAVLASVFTSYGGYRTPDTFVERHECRPCGSERPSSWLGAVAAFAIGKTHRRAEVAIPVEGKALAEAA